MPPLTPLDIQHKEFTKAMRGYAMHEVDTFLDQVTEEFTRLQDEVTRLREQAPGQQGGVPAQAREVRRLQPRRKALDLLPLTTHPAPLGWLAPACWTERPQRRVQGSEDGSGARSPRPQRLNNLGDGMRRDPEVVGDLPLAHSRAQALPHLRPPLGAVAAPVDALELTHAGIIAKRPREDERSALQVGSVHRTGPDPDRRPRRRPDRAGAARAVAARCSTPRCSGCRRARALRPLAGEPARDRATRSAPRPPRAMRETGLGLKAATITPEGADDVGSPNRLIRGGDRRQGDRADRPADPRGLPRRRHPPPDLGLPDGGRRRLRRQAVARAPRTATRSPTGPSGSAARVCRAVSEHSFRTAAQLGGRVYGGPKWTVSPVYEGMLKEEMDAAAERHPEIAYEPVLIDATYAGLISGAADGPLVIPTPEPRRRPALRPGDADVRLDRRRRVGAAGARRRPAAGGGDGRGAARHRARRWRARTSPTRWR